MEAFVIPNVSIRVNDEVDVVVVVILADTLAKPIMSHVHECEVALQEIAVDFPPIGGIPQIHDFRDSRTAGTVVDVVVDVDVDSSFVVVHFAVD